MSPGKPGELWPSRDGQTVSEGMRRDRLVDENTQSIFLSRSWTLIHSEARDGSKHVKNVGLWQKAAMGEMAELGSASTNESIKIQDFILEKHNSDNAKTSSIRIITAF